MNDVKYCSGDVLVVSNTQSWKVTTLDKEENELLYTKNKKQKREMRILWAGSPDFINWLHLRTSSSLKME